MSLRNKYLFYLACIVTLLLLDQASKNYVLSNIMYGTSQNILPGLNLVLRFNPGAAFGMLAGYGAIKTFVLVFVAVLVSTWCLRRLWQLRQIQAANANKSYNYSTTLEIIALILFVSGALGNCLDRLLFDYVIDFIDVYYMSWHWYTFNIADIYLCVGACCYVIVTYIHSEK